MINPSTQTNACHLWLGQNYPRASVELAGVEIYTVGFLLKLQPVRIQSSPLYLDIARAASIRGFTKPVLSTSTGTYPPDLDI